MAILMLRRSLFSFFCVGLMTMAFVMTTAVSSHASLVWTYDFPGTPGSTLGNGQTNPQDTNATFGDWSRVNVSAVGTANVLDSNFWNITSVFDPTQYETFSITAAPGYHLNLQLLTFDEVRTSGGPTKGRVDIFLNGSTTAYDTFTYNPTASIQNQSDNFPPTVDANNVTSVEFRFYGWNGGTDTASLILDNVQITVAIVPEVTSSLIILGLLVSASVGEFLISRRLAAR